MIAHLQKGRIIGIFPGSAAVAQLAVTRRLSNMAKVEKRTYKDRAQYLIQAVTKRRREIKKMAVAYKGGKFIVCGYNKYVGALDLHHLDPKTKQFGFGAKGYTRSWDAIRQEADKCVLVCANCHREIEAGITQLPDVNPVEKRGELREA